MGRQCDHRVLRDGAEHAGVCGGGEAQIQRSLRRRYPGLQGGIAPRRNGGLRGIDGGGRFGDSFFLASAAGGGA